MDIENELKDKLTRLQDITKQLNVIEEKIGVLKEEGRAIHAKGLELKGALDVLFQLKNQQEAKLAQSETAKLTLPVGVKPIVEPVEAVIDQVVDKVVDAVVDAVIPTTTGN